MAGPQGGGDMLASEETLHPFTSYNNPPSTVNAPTLVGNWQEERALKAATGTTRYETNLLVNEAPSLYATKTESLMNQMLTRPRTIDHDAQIHPKDYATVVQMSYKDPSVTAANSLVSYKDVGPKASLGPRAQRELAALMAQAQDLPPEVQNTLTVPPAADTMDSTYRAHYDEKDMTGLRVGARVMRDHDGRPAVRDPTFLAETQIVPRERADRVFGETAKAAGATQTVLLSNPDVPITVYSEAVGTGNYTGAVYGTRTISHTNPFNKHTNFTKPMSAYDKVVIDE